MIGSRRVDGFEALTLSSEEGEIEAAFVPEAGMVGCSLQHRSEELLGQRGGLAHYVAERSTMGIPFLYPWANRLTRRRFQLGGVDVDLDSHPDLLSLDPNGLPIHGLLAGASGWQVERHEATADGAVLAANFEFGARADLLEAFPFPHALRIEAALAGSSLSIETTVTADADTPVPVSFGFHPYLRVPGLGRADWEIEIPVRERLVLDAEELPTGEREPARVEPGRLGSRTFDDEFLAPEDSVPFFLVGADRSVEVSFLSGYRYVQVYAPMDDDVIAFEPRTAPTNALVEGGPGLTMVAPGQSYEARFTITVSSP